jgi:hypothetical protein
VAGRILQQVDEYLLEPVMVGPDRSRPPVTWIRAAVPRDRQFAAALTTSARSHQSRCSRSTPDSIAVESSRSPTRRSIRADSAAMEPRNRRVASGFQVRSGWQRVEA